jgi:hypothetical protein
VIERGGADHQVEGGGGPGQPLGGAHHQAQPVIDGCTPGGVDHRGRSVDPGQDLSLRGVGCQHAQEVAGPAPDVEDPHRGWHAGKGQARHPVSDLMVQRATPALVIALRAAAKRRHVTVSGHS